MRFHFALVTLAILASGGSSHFSLAQEKADGIKLDKRAVPAPAGVSKELRRLISTRQIPPALPVPETRKAWLEMQRTQDANNATAARDLAKKLGATWKSIEVAGVPCFLVRRMFDRGTLGSRCLPGTRAFDRLPSAPRPSFSRSN
jgi:hypothetical protein